jgi:hypothetical protein
MQLATLAPYEVFAEMHRFGRAFSEYILAGYTDCSSFWDALEGCHVPSELRASTVPTYWHTDGGEVTEFFSDRASGPSSPNEVPTVFSSAGPAPTPKMQPPRYQHLCLVGQIAFSVSVL